MHLGSLSATANFITYDFIGMITHITYAPTVNYALLRCTYASYGMVSVFDYSLKRTLFLEIPISFVACIIA